MGTDVLELGCRMSAAQFCDDYMLFYFFKQKTAYEMRISDWSSDVCSSDLRTFVVGAAKGSIESIAIIRAVVALADSLGMSTTAEGAETELEVETLRSFGGSNIQGYYYGRPMPAGDVLTLFLCPGAVATAPAPPPSSPPLGEDHHPYPATPR